MPQGRDVAQGKHDWQGSQGVHCLSLAGPLTSDISLQLAKGTVIPQFNQHSGAVFKILVIQKMKGGQGLPTRGWKLVPPVSIVGDPGVCLTSKFGTTIYYRPHVQSTDSFKHEFRVHAFATWYASSMCCHDLRLFLHLVTCTKVRATSLQLLQMPDYRCVICCSWMRHDHPNFTDPFTILGAWTVISCSSLCTVSAQLPNGCFFQFSFQLSCFSFHSCLHASNSQVQYGCMCNTMLKEKQIIYFWPGATYRLS